MRSIKDFINRYWQLLIIWLILLVAVIALFVIVPLFEGFEGQSITVHEMNDNVYCYTFNSSLDCVQVQK